MYDVERGTAMPLTHHQAIDWTPAWSPDGTRIAFTTNRFGTYDIVSLAADGSEGDEVHILVQDPDGEFWPSWLPDGSGLVYHTGPDKPYNRDLWSVTLTDTVRTPLIQSSEFQVYSPSISPDGRFVAYVSRASGQPEVYVTRYPSGKGRWPVSRGGGRAPVWGSDELFYVSGDYTLTAVPVRTRPAFQVGDPRPLFKGTDVGADFAPRGLFSLVYDVSADGREFVVVAQAEQGEEAQATITVVQNWAREFESGR